MTTDSKRGFGTADEQEVQERPQTLKRHPFYLFLKMSMDTYNVGALFRLADALVLKAPLPVRFRPRYRPTHR